MLSQTTRTAYSLFAQSVILLILYAAMSLFGAAQFVSNTTLSLPYHQISAFANVLLHLAILSGSIGGAIYITARETGTYSLSDERTLMYAYRLWTGIIIAAFLSGVLGLLEGRHMLELPPILDILQIIALLLFVILIWQDSERTPFALVWSLGLILSAVCSVLGLIRPSDVILQRLLQGLAVNLNLNVAYILMALALGFWLMRRFSTVPMQWADMGLYNLAGMLTLAGVLVSLAPLYPLGVNNVLGSITIFIVPILYLIFASHSHKAITERNNSDTLAANWYGLAVLLLLFGVGILGALQSAQGTLQWTLGTRLSDLQVTLTAFGIVAVILGVINQIVPEIRSSNDRITGLMPFWLVTFGVIGGGVALLGAGLVQVYLERILSVGYLETQTYLVPLYMLWTIGLLLTAFGILIYALGFWYRRPQATVL